MSTGSKLVTPPNSFAYLRLTMNSGQVIATATTTKLSLDTVSYASPGWGTAPGAPVTDITMPLAGIVLVTMHDLDFGDAASGVGNRSVFLRKNDVAGSSRAFNNTPATLAAVSIATAQSGSTYVSVAVNDTLQIYVRQTAVGNLTVALNDLSIQYVAFGTFTFTGTN